MHCRYDIFSSAKVLEMRNAENQVVPEDPRFLNENTSTAVPHGESTRRSSHNELPHTELSNQTPYTLNFSFEELNTLGLDEGAPRHSNLSWQVFIKCHFSY
jgi:ankyrin repeat-rich membrane spanning protein